MSALGNVVDAVRQRAAPQPVTGGPLGEGRNPVEMMQALFGLRATGKLVTRDNAVTISALYRAVRILADVPAALPVSVYTKGADGTRRPAEVESTAYIWRRPNPEVNRFVFWNTVFGHLVLSGNAFIYCVPAASGGGRQPVELWPVDPERVEVGRDAEGRKLYRIDGAIPDRDWMAGGHIVHIQGWGTDGLRGLSLVRLGAMGFSLTMAAEQFAAGFYGQSSTPTGGYLSSEQPLTPAQAAELAAMWEEYRRGTENVHRMAVLGRGTKWMSTRLSAEDTQLLDTRQFQVADVARWTGVPEHLLGSHDKQSSWGTGIEVQNRGLLVYALDPMLVNVEQTVTDELLRPAATYMKFERGGLLRGTMKDRAEYLEILRRNLVITANEWRRMEDMEPSDDPTADQLLNPNTKTDQAPSADATAPAPDGGQANG